MTVSERAWQFWPLLVLAAKNLQTVTYRMLAQYTGMGISGLGQCLEPIQAYCLANALPALTSIVVNEEGMPGTGFTAAADVPQAQAQVFKCDWEKKHVPTPTELEAPILAPAP